MRGGAESGKALGWWWAVLRVTLVGGTLRFAWLDAKTLWLDEAFSLWMARHTLPDLFVWLVQIDHHPPLYYVMLHGWIRWFGDGPTALRSLSALASTVAIPVYAHAAGRVAGRPVALVAALLLTLSPFHLRYAQETRMYEVLTLSVALMLLALTQIFVPHRDAGEDGGGGARAGWGWWVLLAVAEAAAMLTHNTATVLVPLAVNAVAFSLWLVQVRGKLRVAGLSPRQWLWAWGLGQAGALLLWSPWAWAFVRQAQVVAGDFWIAPPDTWAVWLALGSLTFAHLPDWLPQRDYWAWFALVLVALGAWQWRRQAVVTWALTGLWLLPPLVELVASLRRPIFYDRTLIWTTLPYFLLIARGIVWPAGVSGRRSWQYISFAAMLTLCGLGVANYYTEFPKERWDEAANFVADEATPQSLVLFHASWAELPFNYYYRDYPDRNPEHDSNEYPNFAPRLLRNGVPADLFDAGVLEPPMTEADVPRVRQLIASHTQVWLVYSHWWYTDPDGILPRVLAEDFAVAEMREWPGIRVLHYVRASPVGE